MSLACVRRTALVEVGTSSCSGIIVDTVQGFVLTHAFVLLPVLTTKTLLIHHLQRTGRLDASHILDSFPTVKVVLCSIHCDTCWMNRRFCIQEGGSQEYISAHFQHSMSQVPGRRRCLRG